MKTSRIKKALVFGAVLLIAAIARIHHLDYESLWMDELRQVSYYPLSYKQIVAAAASQQQPPLDYWIGHIVYLFSSSDFAVRSPSMLFGFGTVFLLTLLANKLTNTPVSAGIGLIAALSPFHVYFSQEARPYSIAIFLCLLTVYLYHKVISSSKDTPKQSIILLFVMILFLYSRALAPLTVVCSLFVCSIGLWISKRINPTKTAALLMIIVTAILIYLPMLNYIISSGKKYLSAADSNSIPDFVKTAVTGFDPAPLWKAFSVQTEPLTYPLLFLTLISPLFILKRKTFKQDSLSAICLFLLVFTSLTHLFIFQAKTDMPFRPPYAIYLSPMILLLSGFGFQGLYSTLEKLQRKRAIQFVMLIIGCVFVVLSAMSCLEFKATRIKTDWRGLCRYLSEIYGPDKMMIFDTLSLYGEPTFFGFSRYYTGDRPPTSMSWLPFKIPQKNSIKPVVILFQWNDYRLTPDSEYPFLKHSEKNKKPVNHDDIIHHPGFTTKTFKNFTVIRLKHETGDFMDDTYAIINDLIDILPEDSSLIELHLAAGALARRTGMPGFKSHFFKALDLANPSQKEKLLGLIPRM